jgi:hypothetical protein
MSQLEQDVMYCEYHASDTGYDVAAQSSRHLQLGQAASSPECACIPTRRMLLDELEMGGAATRRMTCTYGGGGGEDSRRFCLGFGLPLGRDEFLCARNCIVDERRGSCCVSDPARMGSRSGLGLPPAPWRGAGDALRERRSLGETLMLVASGL